MICQVLPIWEGTTNILSLDVLRALAKSNGRALLSFQQDVEDRLYAISTKYPKALEQSFENVRSSASKIVSFAAEHRDILEPAAREFAYSLARTYMGDWLVHLHNCLDWIFV